MSGTFQFRIVAIVVGAMTLIVGGDVAARMLTTAGFSASFAAWARFALAVIVLTPFLGFRKDEMKSLLRPGIILRACLIAAAISCIITALKTEPLATVFGGFFIGPIVSFFLSVLVLKERVTLLRTALLFISFCGVLLVVRPGGGLSTGVIFALMAGTLHGSYLVTTRWLAGQYRPRFLLFSQLLIGAIVLAPTAIGPRPEMTLTFAVLIAISALGSAIGNLLLVIANRNAEASVIAPLIYSQIVIATVMGLVVFGEWPDAIALIGLAIVVVAGAGSIWAAGRTR